MLSDVKGRIIEGGVSERNGDAGIEVCAGTIATRPRYSEYLVESAAGGAGDELTCS